jgi:hypothetical protein
LVYAFEGSVAVLEVEAWDPVVGVVAVDEAGGADVGGLGRVVVHGGCEGAAAGNLVDVGGDLAGVDDGVESLCGYGPAGHEEEGGGLGGGQAEEESA